MGMMRNMEIAQRQAAAGIVPGQPADLLRKMSDTAFELIKIIELELSGIRDGDGFWSGSDPMGGTARELANLIRRYESFRDRGMGAR